MVGVLSLRQKHRGCFHLHPWLIAESAANLRASGIFHLHRQGASEKSKQTWSTMVRVLAGGSRMMSRYCVPKTQRIPSFSMFFHRHYV